MRGKRSVIGHTDIFFRGYGSGFGLCTGIGQQPARQATGEAAGNYSPRGSGLRRCGTAGRGARTLRSFGQLANRLLLFHRGSGGRGGLAAIFCQRLTGQQNRFFRAFKIRHVRRRGPPVPRSFRAAIIKATLLGTPRLKTTRL